MGWDFTDYLWSVPVVLGSHPPGKADGERLYGLFQINVTPAPYHPAAGAKETADRVRDGREVMKGRSAAPLLSGYPPGKADGARLCGLFQTNQSLAHLTTQT